MNELKVTHILKNDLGFSNSSIEKIKKFNNYLLKFNKNYNLISKSTENSIWYRHILDSAQIIKFIDFSKIKNLADFGSGAGFPGLIIALYNENSTFHVKLYEKSKVKRDFLRYVKKNLNIRNITIENNVNIGAGFVSANYDGKSKHKSTIKQNSFIGSNSTIVSPVEINKNAIIGAGSVVIDDVSEHSKVVGVPAKKIKPGGDIDN